MGQVIGVGKSTSLDLDPLDQPGTLVRRHLADATWRYRRGSPWLPYDGAVMSTPQAQREVRERFLSAVEGQVEPRMKAMGFRRNLSFGEGPPGEAAVLYEHDPDEFARRFPNLADAFGTAVAPCIDVWITLNTQTGELEKHLGDLFGLDEWLRGQGSSALADLIWDTNADIDTRMEALAEGFAAYFAQ